jgi:hypothetical protein
MVLKLESKRYTDLASSTYIQWLKCKLWLPNTPSVGGEPFPSLLEAFLHVRPVSKGVRFESMTLTTPSSILMINRIKWKLHRHNESIIRLTSSKQKQNVYKTVTLTRSCKEIVFPFCCWNTLTIVPSYPLSLWVFFRVSWWTKLQSMNPRS